MKPIIFFILLTWSTISCRTADDWQCETPILGSFSVNTNYPNWSNSSCIFENATTGTINLSFNSLDKFCNLEDIVFDHLEKSVGSINLNSAKPDISLLEYNGEDGIIGWYVLDTNYLNTIEILTINDQIGEISGSFNLQFVPYTSYVTKYQDTFYFRNGVFTAKLNK